jgi:hypothetical protein
MTLHISKRYQTLSLNINLMVRRALKAAPVR